MNESMQLLHRLTSLGHWLRSALVKVRHVPQSRIVVNFDDTQISVFEGAKELWAIRWVDVERIGYRTTAHGPSVPDHFLGFRIKGEPPAYYYVSSGWKGAVELAQHVHRFPGAKLTAKGTLADSAKEDSVTIWPSEKAGEPL